MWAELIPIEVNRTLKYMKKNNTEEHKMEQDKEFGYITEKKLKVKAVKLELFESETSKVKKLRIETNEGIITWKPKKKVTQYLNEFPTERLTNMEIEDLPEKLKKIQEACTEKGFCEVKAEYGIIDTKDAEGEPVRYRFINNEKVLERWEIIDSGESKTTEERV